ncbi:MAG TPA: 2-oxoacid:ferredoxin oxidoreductase subunit beta [Ignavibacteriales bacterium]|nr:2-oxoacid:ferredoxin oxidoreductase subunit beta [Ignavibacteriales bacterium]HOL82298.1 2-oxoacid:ferredoxin oxidoreductase subunit beta [Ignavibacteriales bacterium]HOM66348.1 2-oxoacid:ferredoxin oxidoreductase subunit beta [Ignavibacteriales bacterium]HPD68154.1 2-oxoacid:ferredoxin oxidoreductase subunit beta [Ignavibacteriales bacterium]HRR19661.1 2-oxoacid:ferredoxin oxidoreductase subunit beta [Ignavibacteriales bacterium]
MTTNTAQINQVKLTAKDYASGSEVKWCPGCGDYAILATVQKTFAELQLDKSNTVVVSGIGCSSRFPYYMGTYGFHSIHGRAAAIATGVKVHNPKLNVWVATGDGDSLSIGGNHFIHAIRKNVGIKVLLFNNQIYGLTKGQYSPTSQFGQVTKSTPYGSVDYPFNPAFVAIGAGATFFARSADRDLKHLGDVIKRAHEHNGTAIVEILQNCVIFNDGAFENYTEKDRKDDNVVYLEHNKPLVFGKNKNKGIRLNGFTPEVININEGEFSINDCWIHDEYDTNPVRAMILAQFSQMEGFPLPLGVFRMVNKPSLEENIHNQIENVIKTKGEGTLEKLLYSGNTWKID